MFIDKTIRGLKFSEVAPGQFFFKQGKPDALYTKLKRTFEVSGGGLYVNAINLSKNSSSLFADNYIAMEFEHIDPTTLVDLVNITHAEISFNYITT